VPVFSEDAHFRRAEACLTDQSLVTVLATTVDESTVVTLREEFPELSRGRSDPAKAAEAVLVMRSVGFSFYFALIRCVPLDYRNVLDVDGAGPGSMACWRVLRHADHLRKSMAVELGMMAASDSNVSKQVQEEVGQDVPTYVAAFMRHTEDQ
jgi:hypothetical protein